MAQITLRANPSHTPLIVTAKLRGDISLDTPYTLDLAGLLTGALRNLAREADPGFDDGGSLSDDPVSYDLPLARVHSSEGTFIWAATTALPAIADTVESRTFYRTHDPSWVGHYTTRPIPSMVHPKAGPWRNVMMPSPVLLTPSVSWRAIGDRQLVEKALRGIRYIGRRRSVGVGRVYQWQVTEQSVEADLIEWVYLDGDRILRPCYPEIVDTQPFTTIMYPLRPPAWHPDMVAELACSPPN